MANSIPRYAFSAHGGHSSDCGELWRTLFPGMLLCRRCWLRNKNLIDSNDSKEHFTIQFVVKWSPLQNRSSEVKANFCGPFPLDMRIHIIIRTDAKSHGKV